MKGNENMIQCLLFENASRIANPVILSFFGSKMDIIRRLRLDIEEWIFLGIANYKSMDLILSRVS